MDCAVRRPGLVRHRPGADGGRRPEPDVAGMRAVRIIELGGPDALGTADLPEPEAEHFTTPGEGVLIAVANAAVSFPDVLQSRGLYQMKPELPFVPGHE